MNGKVTTQRVLIGFLIFLMAAPPWAMAQPAGTGTFRQEELDQMLAPIALYPDALLAQILVAATYPDQVRDANQWVKANSTLKGDALNAALDNMTWDLSVKALVPFPQVLAMMSDKMDWTEKLGEAFLAQEAMVMDTVQNLRSKAYAEGNLKTTEQQKVAVLGDRIEIQPTNPEVIYVPTYNPTVIYGSWWYPDYPPYAYNPYYPGYLYDPYYTGVGFVTAGLFGFAAGIAVSSAWNWGWGYWNWRGHDCVVNVNRTVNINSNSYTRNDFRTASWRDVSRRSGAGRFSRATAGQGAFGPGRTNRTAGQAAVGQAGTNRAARQGAIGQAGVNRAAGRTGINAGTRPTAASVQKGLQQRATAARARQGTTAAQRNQARMGTARGQNGRGQPSVASTNRAGAANSRIGRSHSTTAPGSRMARTPPSASSRGDAGAFHSRTGISRGSAGSFRGSAGTVHSSRPAFRSSGSSAFRGGGSPAFRSSGGSAFRGGGSPAFRSGGGGFHGDAGAFRGGGSALRGGGSAFHGGGASAFRGGGGGGGFHGGGAPHVGGGGGGGFHGGGGGGGAKHR